MLLLLINNEVDMSHKVELEKLDKSEITGLGDVIDKITTVTGIKYAVKAVAKENCGCEARRKKLNELYPLKK
jgi:hypothetical protein